MKIKIQKIGTSLVVHWLGLHAYRAGGTGLISSQGTKILYACGMAKKN